MKNKKSILIVAHKFTTQPDDDLLLYLNSEKFANVLHILHSFSDAPDRRSWFTWYKEGKLIKREKTKDYKNFSELFIYLKELYFTLKWVIWSGETWDTFIGMDGLCILSGNILKSLRLVNKTIFWAIDFVPENRFSSGVKNKIYKIINVHGYRHSDEMWDLSARMAQAREKFLGIKQTDYKLRRVVPYGVWTDKIKKYSYNNCEKNTLVFMGHLIEKQGVQLVLAAIPMIIKRNPLFRFKIIGAGNYKEYLLRLCARLKIDKYCDFKGKIESHKELEAEIAKSCAAIAPYIKELDTWSYYADPGKVKTYLACGVPVLLTDLPWNAGDIEKHKCGKIISENPDDIIKNIMFLMNSANNQFFRDNAASYAKAFNYKNIFSQLEI